MFDLEDEIERVFFNCESELSLTKQRVTEIFDRSVILEIEALDLPRVRIAMEYLDRNGKFFSPHDRKLVHNLARLVLEAWERQEGLKG